jgi:hypothetical protein
MNTTQSNQARVLLSEMVTRAVPNECGTHTILISTELLNIVRDFLSEVNVSPVEDVIPVSHPASKNR